MNFIEQGRHFLNFVDYDPGIGWQRRDTIAQQFWFRGKSQVLFRPEKIDGKIGLEVIPQP
ncbi:hypothetical protein EBZ80_19100 [bacterium]|nr:hypothetical protein [bacterium]